LLLTTDHFSPECYSETRIDVFFILDDSVLLMCIVAICQRLFKRIYGQIYGWLTSKPLTNSLVTNETAIFVAVFRWSLINCEQVQVDSIIYASAGKRHYSSQVDSVMHKERRLKTILRHSHINCLLGGWWSSGKVLSTTDSEVAGYSSTKTAVE